jgi:redox-sensitive bicupin YhaK (pirin superfamily)
VAAGELPSERIRLVTGELESRSVASRTVLPTPAQGAWPPFRRVGEIAATVRRKLPSHGHEAEEVLTYLVEGHASAVVGDRPAVPVQAPCVLLLDAPGKVGHQLSPDSAVRWVSVVVSLPKTAGAGVTAERYAPTTSGPLPDGTIQHRLLGAGARFPSRAGVECSEIEFVAEGTAFQRIGRDRRAIVYAIRRRGRVDGTPIEEGEAALMEDVSGIALHGGPGFRALLTTAPRPP